jgi:hypothetical protein
MTKSSVEVTSLIHALAFQGANLFDPVGFHYLETLSTRANDHQGRVRRILDDKLCVATLAFRDRFEKAQGELMQPIAAPNTADPRETLRGLVRRLAQTRPDPAERQPELKSVTHFRNTWSKLSVQKQVAQALSQAPKSAGPINSHRVALRALTLMRDTSPDYLTRFMSYVDTLLRLDRGESVPLASRKTSGAMEVGKKTRVTRRQTR